jgi:hypothetical protein
MCPDSAPSRSNLVGPAAGGVAFWWDSGGQPAYVTWADAFVPTVKFSGIFYAAFSGGVVSGNFATVQLARDTGSSTSIATVTVTANAADCVFAAQAVVQPG